jgi:hypothetical protein
MCAERMFKMETTHSIWDLIQDEHILVSQNNDLIIKCKGNIKNLTDDERERLMNIRASIRMRRSILRSYLSETANYGVPVLKEESDDENSERTERL